MLYFCATPIGNLMDITERVRRALCDADYVAAEDTRVTGVLLRHLGVQKPMISCHAHNEGSRTRAIMELLEQGKIVAYCSDAGMPLISDPGEELMAACIERGLPFTVLPGASAVLTGLSVSGFAARRFVFEGFLPRDKKTRREILSQLREEPRTIVLFESPRRVAATLLELREVLGERGCALARELTKLHEEIVRGTLSELGERYGKEAPRGECVLVIEGKTGEHSWNEEELFDSMRRHVKQGMRPRDAAKAAALLGGGNANRLYSKYVQMHLKTP